MRYDDGALYQAFLVLAVGVRPGHIEARRPDAAEISLFPVGDAAVVRARATALL
jgi:hypothetical protein